MTPSSAISSVTEPTAQLPETPVVVIEPHRGNGLDIMGVWTHRELLYFLAWRDIKIRYKQTALGALWAILQPLLTMMIFTVLFGRLANMSSGSTPYALFAYAGLLPWGFFSNAITTCGNCLVTNAHLINKVYFPRLIIPAATVLSGLMDLFVAFGFYLILMAWYGVGITWQILLFPVMTLLMTLLAIGLGVGLAALNVKYRDIRYTLPFIVQLGLFVTPIIYPAKMVPAKWQWALALNPMTGIIEGYRSALLGTPIDGVGLLISFLYAVALMAGGAAYFRSVEQTFADLV